MFLSRRLWTFLSKAAVVTLLFAPHATQSTIDLLSVIGDSLTDTGNVFRLTNYTIPTPAYYFEGRFTNGEVWVDVLSSIKGENFTVRNFAFGGATSDNAFVRGMVKCKEVPSGMHQLNEILRQFAIDRHLYAVWIGSNDYLNMAKYNPHMIDSKFVRRSVKITLSIIRRLIKSGAKSILTLTIPPLERTPLIQAKPPIFRTLIANAVRLHNALLRHGIKLEVERAAKLRDYPKPRVGIFDAYSLSILTIDNRLFGIENVEDPCLHERPDSSPSEAIPTARAINAGCNSSRQLDTTKEVCQNPDRLFFYDQVHPSTKVHRVLGSLLSLFLEECFEREVGRSNDLGECIF